MRKSRNSLELEREIEREAGREINRELLRYHIFRFTPGEDTSSESLYFVFLSREIDT